MNKQEHNPAFCKYQTMEYPDLTLDSISCIIARLNLPELGMFHLYPGIICINREQIKGEIHRKVYNRENIFTGILSYCASISGLFFVISVGEYF